MKFTFFSTSLGQGCAWSWYLRATGFTDPVGGMVTAETAICTLCSCSILFKKSQARLLSCFLDCWSTHLILLSQWNAFYILVFLYANRILAGGKTALIFWCSLRSLPSIMKLMVPMSLLELWGGMMNSATWTQQALTPLTPSRITPQCPPLCDCWDGTTSSPYLLSPTIPMTTMRWIVSPDKEGFIFHYSS